MVNAILLGAVFLLLGVLFFSGRGSGLVSGFPADSAGEQKQHDTKKLCLAIGTVCLVIAGLFAVLAYLNSRVDSGALSEKAMLLFAAVFLIVMFAAVGAAVCYVRSGTKRK